MSKRNRSTTEGCIPFPAGRARPTATPTGQRSRPARASGPPVSWDLARARYLLERGDTQGAEDLALRAWHNSGKTCLSAVAVTVEARALGGMPDLALRLAAILEAEDVVPAEMLERARRIAGRAISPD